MRAVLGVVVALALAAAAVRAAAQEPAASRVPDAAQFVGQPKGTPLTGDALFRRTQEVGSLIRCPVCQGMAIADSPAEMAVNMKEQVRELLARGYTEEQILQYFELSYGQFVLLKPKFEGVNRLVWILPLAALLAGGAVVYFKLKKLEAPAPAPPPDAAVRQTAAEPEDAYLARVRELVRGDES
jgi:cytochrome c-type biogenesis protein CcmH